MREPPDGRIGGAVCSGTLGRDLARGAVAGAVAWWAMDHVLMFLYNHQDPAVRRREARARRGIPALEAIAERFASAAGVALTAREREKAGTALQWIVGIGMGALYGALRGRVPGARAGRGLGYGAAASLLIDEGLIPLLGFAPGPAAFPWQTHARGFAGHLVFGGVADATLALLTRQRGWKLLPSGSVGDRPGIRLEQGRCRFRNRPAAWM